MKELLLVPLIVASGCASQAELQLAYLHSHQAVMAQTEVMSKQPPTFSIDCSTGCGSAKIDYLDPRDRMKLVIPKVTGTNDTIIGVAPTIVKGVGYVAGAVTAIRVFDDAFGSSGGNNTEVHNNSNTVGDNNVNNQDAQTAKADNNTNQSEDNDYTANQANQQNQDNDITNNDVNNDKSTHDRNDVVNNDNNSDNSNNSNNSQQNQTATPTVVNPVTVDPVVVNPVVVETGAE